MKSLKDILPWEDRPEGCKDVMWRYSKNRLSAVNIFRH